METSTSPGKSVKARWPKQVNLGKLVPEERVNTSVEMSSVMGEILLDSIRDEHPGISESKLLSLARARIRKGRRFR